MSQLRESIGSSPFHSTSSLLSSQPDANGFAVNWRSEVTRNMFTGSSLLDSSESSDSEESNAFLEIPPTPNSLGVQQPRITYGRATLPSQTPDLNLVSDQSSVVQRPIGTRSGNPLWTGNSNLFLPEFEYPVTPHSLGLQRTISNRQLLREPSPFTLDPPVSVSRDALGRPQVGMLTLRTRTPSSGTATADRSTLSWTSSEERSTSATSSDGPIDTPCPLRQRDQAPYLTQSEFGSLPIFILTDGIPTSTKKQKTL